MRGVPAQVGIRPPARSVSHGDARTGFAQRRPGVAALAFLLSVTTDSPLGAVGGAVGLVIVSNILDAVTALASARDFLPTHWMYAWMDVLQPEIQWTGMAKGAAVSISYAMVLFALAFRRSGTATSSPDLDFRTLRSRTVRENRSNRQTKSHKLCEPHAPRARPTNRSAHQARSTVESRPTGGDDLHGTAAAHQTPAAPTSTEPARPADPFGPPPAILTDFTGRFGPGTFRGRPRSARRSRCRRPFRARRRR